MDNLEIKIDLLIDFVTCDNVNRRYEIQRELLGLKNSRQENTGFDADSTNVPKCIDKVLLEIGIPSNLLGREYIKHAIALVVDTSELGHTLTKGLYPAVARICGSTATRVERAIRHAVTVAWERGDISVLHSYFGYTVHPSRGRPTNGEFINQIATIISEAVNKKESNDELDKIS